MVMCAKIRRMYFREHLNISEIKRRTSLSRNTIKKWLNEATEPQYQRRKRDGKLTPFEPMLKKRPLGAISIAQTPSPLKLRP